MRMNHNYSEKNSVKWYNNFMEIQREIRAFYIKLPRPITHTSQKLIEALWNLSKGIHIISIDIQNDEILIHSEVEFSFENWDASVKYLKSIILLLKKKYAYIIVRRVIASKNGLKTELEGYKITKRGVYLSDLPDCPGLIEDALRFSGRNKGLQFADSMENIFKSIEEQDKETDSEEF